MEIDDPSACLSAENIQPLLLVPKAWLQCLSGPCLLSADPTACLPQCLSGREGWAHPHYSTLWCGHPLWVRLQSHPDTNLTLYLFVFSFFFHFFSQIQVWIWKRYGGIKEKNISIFLFFNILFIYSRKTHTERQRHKQRKKQAPHRESDAGLNPKTLGSWPEPKADT